MIALKAIQARDLHIVAEMQRAGVNIMAGTDFLPNGFALHRELAMLVEAGLTPMQALQAATLNPARYFGKEQEFGTIGVGKAADLVLLDANPLADIHNTQKISAVVARGHLLERAQLDGMLAQVAQAGAAEKARP
ncbi:MAG: amidohydrolase family protein [Steroidobacteraceae bacterium]